MTSRTARMLAATVALAALAVAPAISTATGSAPTASSGSASSITATSATLTGTVDPNGTATIYLFQYGATDAYGSQTTAVAAGSGTTNLAASATINGLASGSTYHFRLVATSANGTTNGADATFTTTTSPPLVTTGGTSSVTGTSAVLAGTVNPNGKSTSYAFQYGTSTSYGLETATASAGAGSAPVAVDASATGLLPGTKYHYRVIATNPDGTSTGADETLTTVKVAPGIQTGAPSVVSSNSAVLTAIINGQGKATTYSFQYGPTTAYGSQTAFLAAGSPSTNTEVAATIGGLAAGTVYHYRIVATSPAGTAVGADESFVTTAQTSSPDAPAPAVFGASAVGISASGAQLNGALDPPATPTTWYFEYGLGTAYGARTTPQTLSGLGARPINVKLSGLEAAATFHFRLVAQSGTTLYVGPDTTFTTKAALRLSPSARTLSASSTTHGHAIKVLASGTLRPPASATGTCNGVVEIQIEHSPYTISLRSAPLTAACSYRETITFSARALRGVRRLTVAAHFLGNATLLPIAARALSVAAHPST